MDALFNYTKLFYDLLLQNSTVEVVEGIKMDVYQGAVTEEFRKLKISQSYYSKMNNILIEQGCITQLQRGASRSPTILALHHPPDLDEYQMRRPGPLTRRLDYATLAQRLDDVIQLLGGIDIKKALVEQQKEIKELRRRIDKFERQDTSGT